MGHANEEGTDSLRRLLDLATVPLFPYLKVDTLLDSRWTGVPLARRSRRKRHGRRSDCVKEVESAVESRFEEEETSRVLKLW